MSPGGKKSLKMNSSNPFSSSDLRKWDTKTYEDNQKLPKQQDLPEVGPQEAALTQ